MNNKKEKYSIRKLTIGCASCLIGLFIGLSTDSYAAENNNEAASAPASTSTTNSNSIVYVNNANSSSGIGNGSESSPFNDLRTALERVASGGTISLKETITVSGNGPIVVNKPVTIEGNHHTINVRGHNIIMNADTTMKNVNIAALKDGAINPTIYTGNNDVTFNNVKTLVSSGQPNERPDLVVGTKDIISTDKKANVKFVNSSSDTIFKSITVGGSNPAEHSLTLDKNLDSHSGLTVENRDKNYTINTESKITDFSGTSENTGTLVVNSKEVKNYNFENINSVIIKKDISATKVAGVNNLILENNFRINTPTEIDNISGTGKLTIPVNKLEPGMYTPLTVTNVSDNITVEFDVSGNLNEESNGLRFIATPNVIKNVNLLNAGYNLVKTESGYLLRKLGSKIVVQTYKDDNNDGVYDEDEFVKDIELDYIDENLSSYKDAINKAVENEKLMIKEGNNWIYNENNFYNLFLVEKTNDVIGEITETTYEDLVSTAIDYIADPTLELGEERLKKVAEAGSNKVVTRYKTINGKKTNEIIGTPEVTTSRPPKNKIVAIGVKEVKRITSDIETKYIAEDTKDKGIDENVIEKGVANVDEIVYNYEVVRGTGELINKKEVSRTNKTKGKPTVIKVPTKEIEDEVVNRVKYLADDSKDFGYEYILKGEPNKTTTTYYWTVDPKTGAYLEKVKVNTITEKEGTPDIIIKGTKTSVTNEVLNYKTVENKISDKPVGYRRVINKGVNGYNKVTTRYVLDETNGKISTVEYIERVEATDEVVEVGTFVENIVIPYETEYVADYNREYGSENVIVKKGVNGLADRNNKIIEEKINKVISVGAKPKEETKNIPFSTTYLSDITKDLGYVSETDGTNGVLTYTTTYKVNPKDGTVSINKDNGKVTTPVKNKVITKGTKPLIEKEAVSYETEYRADNEKEYGTEIEEGGVEGEKTYTTTYTLDTISGKITSNKNTGVVTKQPENKIITKGTKPTIKKTVIPYDTITKNDSSIDKGVTIVKQEGLNGEIVVETTYKVNPISGEITQTPVINTKSPINKVIVVGTKEINNVKITKKGESLVNEDKPTITVEEIKKQEITKKGESLVNKDKPAITVEEIKKQEITKKGKSLVNEDKPAITVEEIKKQEITKKGKSLVNEDKPTISVEEIKKQEITKKGKSLVSEDKPTISAEEISETTSKKDKLPATGLNSSL